MNTEITASAKMAVQKLMHHYKRGAYRAIKDPDGVISLWAIDSNPNEPFSISFVDKGRVYYKIEDVPDSMLKSFTIHVQQTIKGKY